MPQKNRLAGGEHRYTWRGRTYQLEALLQAVIDAYPGVAGMAIDALAVTFWRVSQAPLIFLRDGDVLADDPGEDNNAAA